MLVIWSSCKLSDIQAETKHIKVSKRFHYGKKIPELKKGDVLFCLGGFNLKAIQAEGYLPKNRTISSLREIPHKFNDATLFVSFDADIKSFDHTSYVKLQIDFKLVTRYINTGSIDCVLGDYRWVDNFNHLPKIINNKYNDTGRAVRVSLDLETVGLIPFDPDKFIVSISFSIEEGKSELIRFLGVDDQPKKGSQLLDCINWLINDDRIALLGANLKYDLLWLWVKWGIQTTNFKFDTTLVGSLLDENRSNSLNTHTKIYTESLGGYDDSFNISFDKSRMDLVPDEDLLPYAGGDTSATLQVGNKMITALSTSKSQANFYRKLLHPASMAFLDMEYTGIHVDREHYQKLEKELVLLMDGLTIQAKELLPARILAKYGNAFALSKSSIIKEFMFTHSKGLKLKPKMVTEKTGQPSTAYNHLVMFADVPEAKAFIDILKQWNSAKKTLSTYVIGFMKHLREDAKVHPTAVLYRGGYEGKDSGSVTGRLAFSNPAFNVLPKHTKWAKKLRKGYPAPGGYCMVSWDYSQGELRVIACVANELNMIQAYKDGIDLHLKTGAELNGMSLEKAMQLVAKKDKGIKKIRQQAKAINFGNIYQISAGGLVIYARDTYWVILTEDEAQQKQNKFFEMYPAIPEYHDSSIKFAEDNGFVQSPLGRVRHLPMINSNNWGAKGQAGRQAINSKIQSCLSDMTQLALAEFKKKYGYTESCKFFAMTHDAISAYIKIDEVDFWVPEVKHIMENLPLKEYFAWEPQLKFLTDAEIGYNMADMVELIDYPNMKPSEILKTLA